LSSQASLSANWRLASLPSGKSGKVKRGARQCGSYQEEPQQALDTETITAGHDQYSLEDLLTQYHRVFVSLNDWLVKLVRSKKSLFLIFCAWVTLQYSIVPLELRAQLPAVKEML